MTKTKIALATLIALSLGACAKTEAAKPVDAAKIAEAVKADAAQLVVDLNAKDIDKAVAHDAANVVAMFHGAPNANGVAEDKAGTTEGVAKDPAFHLAVSGETVDVAQAGDMAVWRSTYTATVTDPKTRKVGTETGNWVAVYKAQADGSWKIALNIVSDAPPAPPAAAPAAAAPEKK
jgi:ketosteroid isomerase-like protein